MPKQAKTAERVRTVEVEQGIPCPECGKPTRVVRRIKNREMSIAGGMYLSCTVCEFAEKK